MECNKDEATRAKGIAEKKLMQMDIAGAKKFASKAQNLFPALEGLSQFLEVLDVYISAEKMVNGEVDWYAVLGVDPLADDETVRKQYRRLALALHPDKNKSVGADGAFKILSQAWGLFSDKARRVAYDQKRNLRNIYQKVSGNPSMPAGKNGFHASTDNNNATAGNQRSSTNPQPTPAPPRPSKSNGTTTNSSARKQTGFTNRRRTQTHPRPSKPDPENSNSNATNQKSSSNPQPTPVPSCPSKPITFWTLCNQCMMQHEYVKPFLNQKLLCPNCRKPFLAVEFPAPAINAESISSPWPSCQQEPNANLHIANNNSSAFGRESTLPPNVKTGGSAGGSSVNSMNIQQGLFFRSVGIGSGAASATLAAEAPYFGKPAHENLKRGREEAVGEEVLQRKSNAFENTGFNLSSNAGPGFGKGDRPMKKRRQDEKMWNNSKRETVNPVAMGNTAGGQGIVSGYPRESMGVERVGDSGSNKHKSVKGLNQAEVRSMLMAKARLEICQKLNEWSIDALSKDSHKEGSEIHTQKPKGENLNSMKKCRNINGASVDTKNPIQPRSSSLSNCSIDLHAEATAIMLMSVPDSDFHDFDKDRTERSFGENQVWAAYDSDDGMPRYYALIHGVISKKPFKVKISWLNSKSNSELGPLNWIGIGFVKTSGDFRVGKHEVSMRLNSFSHRVKWTKGEKGVIRIFPRKGDAWALYRNWSPDWNEFTPDEVIHKYDMVEVLEDYSEEQGVTVAPLVKVAGFKSVFHQHLDPKQILTIPKEEMFRFSHQVPSCLLTGQEAQNAPKGCRELDPAAMPLDLLQVITEAKDADTVEDAGRAKTSEGLVGDRKSKEELYGTENYRTTKDKEMSEDDNMVVPEAIVRNSNGTKGNQMAAYINKGKEKTRFAGIE